MTHAVDPRHACERQFPTVTVMANELQLCCGQHSSCDGSIATPLLEYRDHVDVYRDCDPQGCFMGIGQQTITSKSCATAYARLFNISNATPLANVAETVNAIQNECVQLTTEVLSHFTQLFVGRIAWPLCSQQWSAPSLP